MQQKSQNTNIFAIISFMKKIILINILLSTLIFANIKAVVSIAPMVSYLKAIGGDRVDVTLMVKAGSSPHTYEPKPSDMRSLSSADVYYAIGVEFENVWLSKFQTLNPSMQIIHTDANITKEYMQNSHNHNQKGHKDPHIWTSIKNIKIIATHIYKSILKIDSQNALYYKANYDKFIKHLDSSDKHIQSILANTPKGSRFMVFHPSWGYFAKDYNLTQMPIEIEGKKPKAKEIISIIKEAKKFDVKAIFTQPEFSDITAKMIANELHIQVIKVSPLSPHWEETLLKIANAIAHKDTK